MKIYTIKESTLSAIADAIREVEGSSAQINSDDFADRIRALVKPEEPVAPELLSISATKVNTTYTVGDYLDTDDITVTAYYSDGSSKVVTDATFSTIDTSSAGTKILTIAYDGKTATISIIVNPVNEETVPNVPQTGTPQLKTTTLKRYFIIGTDDDNSGNVAFARALETYGFPYTMNMEAENISKIIDNGNTDQEWVTAPNHFDHAPTVTELGKYIIENGLGEVAQHGSSHLVDTRLYKENGEEYTAYVTAGGTRSFNDWIAYIRDIPSVKIRDVAQGASYVADSKKALEEALGHYIYTVGIWGGAGKVQVDGIDVSLQKVAGGKNYDWRGDNYIAGALSLDYWAYMQPKVSPYYIFRGTFSSNVVSEVEGAINKLVPGQCYDFFWHFPWGDMGKPVVKDMLDKLKEYVDSGKAECITRKQYGELFEYVSNPITSIIVNREPIVTGETDSDAAYTIAVRYQDGTTSAPEKDVIIDRSSVNTSTEGSYTVKVYYRGFIGTTTVNVAQALNLPTFNTSVTHYAIISNGDEMRLLATNKPFTIGISGGAVLFSTQSGGKAWTYKSSDAGATWTAIKANVSTYSNIKSTAADYWGEYTFNNSTFKTFKDVTAI